MRNPAEAYAQTAKTTETNPRRLEASVLMRAATRLQACRDAWKGFDADLDAALIYNRKLWTVLSTSATANDNPLPQALKDNIATLAVFVFKRTFEIIASPTPEKLDALVAINRDLAAGLSAQPAQAAPAPVPQAMALGQRYTA